MALAFDTYEFIHELKKSGFTEAQAKVISDGMKKSARECNFCFREELQDFAKKDDLKDFAKKDDLKDFAKKEDLKDFVTKADIKDFITKDDIKDFITKDDIKDFITKDDIKDFITKDDIKDFVTKNDLKQELRVLEIDLRGEIKQMANVVTLRVTGLMALILTLFELFQHFKIH